MKKGDGAGLIILVSIITLIIAISYYFVFLVIVEKGKINIKTTEEIESELDIYLINLVKLNSNLIIKSIKNNDYTKLEEEIYKLNFDECWDLKIDNKEFNKNKCILRKTTETSMKIPDYKNREIEIKLRKNKNE